MHFSASVSALRCKLLAMATVSLLVLAACGGGGGGSSGMSSASPAPVAPNTGKVAIMLTDAPTDRFCQILATVEHIDLLGSSGKTNVFTGPVTVDLLKLRNYTDFFSIESEVPVGTYSKVRLTLSDLALVECDAAGDPEPALDWDHPHLPGNGKLDLNPRASFQVIGGETLLIRFDMDMAKSLFVHQTGNGKWQFRPVIFCDIAHDHDKLVRVFGTAHNISGTQFELCPLRPTATMTAMSGGGTTPSSECLDVFTDGKTGIFDKTGSPVGPSAIAEGDQLTAIGFIKLFDDAGTHGHDDADDNDEGDEDDDAHVHTHDLALDAVTLELGNSDTFKRIPGTVVSAPGNNDLFVFDPMPSTTNAIDVRLQSGTRIFALGSTTELTSAALQPGTLGQVDGVFTIPATSGEPLKSSLIVLAQDTTPAVTLLDAAIQSPIPADDDAVPATRRFTVVNTANPAGKCVKTDAGTHYLLITETSTTSETQEIAFADLVAGDVVDVFGANDVTDTQCVLADTIQKYTP